MTKEKELRRKAAEIYLSGRQTSGRGTEKGQKEINKELEEEFQSLAAPVSTKEMRIRGRKKGKKTPRQTFRCDEVLWKQFIRTARKKESKSASEILRRFIYRYVHGGK